VTSSTAAHRARFAFLISTESLVLLTVVAFVLADAVIIWIGLNGDFAFDFDCCYRQAGVRVLDDPSALYAWSPGYLFRYSPLAAMLLSPLSLLNVAAAPWAWLMLKLAALAALATWYARPWIGRQRLLIFLCVLCFPPLVHDLVLGNVSVFTFGVLLALLRGPQRPAGALMGLLLLLAPKPHLLPVAAWLLIRRPRAALSMLATFLVGLGVGLLIFGVDVWLAYVRTFAEPLSTTFTANIGVSGLLGPVGVVVGSAMALASFVVAARRSDAFGLGLAIVSGILAGPYTFIHYLSGSLVAVEPILRTRPRLLAPFAWLMIVFPLIPVWLVALAGVLGWSQRRYDEAAAPPTATPG
jgi:hypothetical protein